ncbi:DNA repair protein RecO [Auritidibacter ignavus]|uniref:DNA repair protein RecO n=1 Tax=Auritidibacter ignavus TaxID=678932 RepID=UPI002FE6513A
MRKPPLSKTRGGSGGSRSRRGGASYVAQSYRCDAIVLRTYKLAETDRIIVALSNTHGQIRAVARGVRRTTSKFGSSLEPFMHTGLQVVPGKSLDIIAQTQTIHPYGAIIAADYDSYGAASAMVETAERLTRAEDTPTTAEHYRLLYGAMAALAKHQHPPRLIMDSYLLRALALAGWGAHFGDCVSCGAPGPHVQVSILLGGTVCFDCRPQGALAPSRQAISLLAALATGDWDAAGQALADATAHELDPSRVIEEASSIVAQYLRFHVEQNLHSLQVMNQREL